MNFDFEKDAQDFGNRGFDGDMITKPGTIRIRMPKYEQLTQFRAFPAVDQQGSILPWRKGVQQNQFNPFMVLLPSVVRMCGLPSSGRTITFLDHIPSSPGGETPYGRIMKVINGRKKDPVTGSQWEALTKGGNGVGANIPFPQNMVALQGLTLQHGGKDFRNDPKNEVLLFPKTATDALMFNLHSQGVNPQSQNIEEQFLGGDITSPARGSLINLMKKQAAQGANQPQMSFGNTAGPQYAAQNQNQKEFQQYAVWFEPSPPVDPSIIKNMWRQWDQLIRTLTVSEMVKELCTVLIGTQADPGYFLVAFFRDSQFEEHVPENLRNAYFANRGMTGYSQPVPASPYPGSPPMVQGYPPAPGYAAPGYAAPAAPPAGFPMPAAPATGFPAPGYAAPAAAPQGFPMPATPAGPMPGYAAPAAAPQGYPQPAAPQGFPPAPGYAAPAAPPQGYPQPAAPNYAPPGASPTPSGPPNPFAGTFAGASGAPTYDQPPQSSSPFSFPAPVAQPAPAAQPPAPAMPAQPPATAVPPQPQPQAGPQVMNPGIAASADRLAQVMQVNNALKPPQ